MTAIAIDGLGRIDRAFLKVAMTRQELRVVAVNNLIDPENLVYLLRFDSAYRRYDQPVAYEPGVEPTLRVGRTRMRLVSEREPKRLPWKKLGVDIVIEATRRLRNIRAGSCPHHGWSTQCRPRPPSVRTPRTPVW